MKILLFRRLTQILILVAFIVSNHYGLKLLLGDLSASSLFGAITFADPFALLQLILAGASVGMSVIIGAMIVAILYAVIAPRAFCAWVCPVNLFTDMAAKLREKLGFNKDAKLLNLPKNTRYYLLLAILVFSALLSLPVFESVSFVGMVQRGIIYLDIFVLAAIFVIIVFDMFVLPRGICGYICPLGAFYALLSKFSLIRISHDLSKCNKCAKCLKACPEPQVLSMVGHKSGFVTNSECISCGRCIDVCNDDAMKFSIRNLKEER
ncbi:quinol dehydrogenase ferredoxin subunit NapH [Campylobacter sp. RM13119]|uniref:quinol dehydrogenase ferredoxin subunit NapH n=1 Tax=Campylobacter TaxID=194 RepID=UPI001476598A|nr:MULTISPECIES: quinol dehydrogenase ferredoxin subunit NapH [unclassified Campylobacter]MBE3022426.1 quinol dehydrogenase ferredoxin subunit NapH [Campylobacter sp. 7477a]MBE3606514.1 quinol dehydrogenase ferredoxin subunit NapH [Campylobacter sp. RM13119]MBE3610085.1 quinol dehydrogenase ferredoxin subunit NapH [Campylobacter sp. RM12916]